MFTPEFLGQVVLYGAMAIAAVELIKKVFKLDKFPDYAKILVTVVAAFPVCLPALSGGMELGQWLILVGCVILEANGLFKAFHTKSG